MKEDEEPATPEPVKATKASDATATTTTTTTTTATDDGFTSVGKSGKVVAEVDDKPILVRLGEVLESRGKKVMSSKGRDWRYN
jgi:translation initiation factor 3 subunit C